MTSEVAVATDAILYQRPVTDGTWMNRLAMPVKFAPPVPVIVVPPRAALTVPRPCGGASRASGTITVPEVLKQRPLPRELSASASELNRCGGCSVVTCWPPRNCWTQLFPGLGLT